jgi:hypothetical protein
MGIEYYLSSIVYRVLGTTCCVYKFNLLPAYVQTCNLPRNLQFAICNPPLPPLCQIETNIQRFD